VTNQERFEELFTPEVQRKLEEHVKYLDCKNWEDIYQETLLRAFQYLHRFTYGKFFYWLRQIAVHASMDVIRRSKKQRNHIIPYDAYACFEPIAPEAREHLPISEEMNSALLCLPENQRRIIELFCLGEFKYEEISAVESIPVGTVMSRLFRARKRMQYELEPHYDRRELASQ
jgi:RNA polymerase sigma-70 factor (ECF subfamily)